MEVVNLNDVKSSAVALTRREKMLRWSDLIRQQQSPMHLFHDMERWSLEKLSSPMRVLWGGEPGPNAFTVASTDPAFKAAGLKGDSVSDAVEFFELSQDELHEFSCDCGGDISNAQMAERVGRLADRGPPSLLGRMTGR